MGVRLDWKWHATDDCTNMQWLPVALHDQKNHTNPLGILPLLLQQMITLLVLFFFRKTPPNPPRTRPGEGMRNYERAHNQSEMAAILRGEGNQRPSTPARNVRHLQRSELWWWQQGCGASCCRDWFVMCLQLTPTATSCLNWPTGAGLGCKESRLLWPLSHDRVTLFSILYCSIWEMFTVRITLKRVCSLSVEWFSLLYGLCVINNWW